MVIDDHNLHVCMQRRMVYLLFDEKPKLDIKKSTFEPSKLIRLLVYQDFDFILKSLRTTIIKEFFSHLIKF